MGEPALRATLVVPEPDGDTWPVDTYFALRRAVNQIAVQLGFDEVVYVDLSAPSDIEEQADTDDDGDPETDAAVDAAIAEHSTTDTPERRELSGRRSCCTAPTYLPAANPVEAGPVLLTFDERRPPRTTRCFTNWAPTGPSERCPGGHVRTASWSLAGSAMAM